MREARASLKGSVGFVPTMGFLHEGHMSLVRSASNQNSHAIVSIFVNPSQFGPEEDFDRYPRDIDKDLALLADAGVDYVFMPDETEIYPVGHEASVEVGSVALPLEGAARPGHFRGVATVVLKLFNIVQPHSAYFGSKDAQQVAVVQRLVRDLDLPVEIVPMPTIREPSGLAMSTRNSNLAPVELEFAASLWQALSFARELWIRGVRDAVAIRSRVQDFLEEAPGAEVEYVAVSDPQSFQELERIQGPALVSLAVRIGDTRLIDNLLLGE